MALKTIRNIDVLWVKERFGHDIARAFEVEETTSIYSGILRMADLLALLPNLNIKIYIVAPEERKEKVIAEITRPAFSYISDRRLSNTCFYLSYDSIYELFEEKSLEDMKDTVIDTYAMRADNLV